MTSLVPSEYPSDAIEMTFTVVVDMTGEPQDSQKYDEILGATLSAAHAAGAAATWLTSDYVRSPDGQWREQRYVRPPAYVRPRNPRRKSA